MTLYVWGLTGIGRQKQITPIPWASSTFAGRQFFSPKLTLLKTQTHTNSNEWSSFTQLGISHFKICEVWEAFTSIYIKFLSGLLQEKYIFFSYYVCYYYQFIECCCCWQCRTMDRDSFSCIKLNGMSWNVFLIETFTTSGKHEICGYLLTKAYRGEFNRFDKVWNMGLL